MSYKSPRSRFGERYGGDGQISTKDPIYSSVITGLPPLYVASITVVSNLNVDLLDGKHADDILSPESLKALVDRVNFLSENMGLPHLCIPELETAGVPADATF